MTGEGGLLTDLMRHVLQSGLEVEMADGNRRATPGASRLPDQPLTFSEMTQLDYLYVTGWSLKQDIRLILLTIPSLFKPRQAA